MIGAGEWGLSVANHLSNLGSNVNVYIRNERNLHSAIETYHNSKNLNFYNLKYLSQKNINTSINIIASSSAGFASIINDHKKYFANHKYLCWLTKGLDHDSGLLFHDVIDKILNKKIDKCIISGPSFARDLNAKKSIEISIASTSKDLSILICSSLKTPYFNMVPTTNIIGVEVSGIIKNISAILAGILTANNQSEDIDKLIALSLNDIQIMSNKVLKNNPKYQVSNEDLINISSSPACLGDLRLTCLQDISRNRQFGLKITPGIDIKKLLSDIGTVEGYLSTLTLKNNQTYFGLSKIVDSAYKILYLHDEPKEVMKKLLD